MWTTMDSPVGELRIVASDDAITAIEFDSSVPEGTSPRSSAARAVAVSVGRPRGGRDETNPLLREMVRQLRAYFARELKEFDIPRDPDGSPFQRRVWAQLEEIGYGETASYGAIAAALGMTAAASRAVGLANGRNPIPIVIPCHRVVGADGRLTGYAGGLERKRLLLELEQDARF